MGYEKDAETLDKVGMRLSVISPEEGVERKEEKKQVRLAPNGKISELSEEDYEYVHSDEFKKLFGDWEKAYRLEKLINSEPVVTDGKIFLKGKDITNEINELRQKRNIKGLKNYAKKIGNSIKNNVYVNNDTQDLISVSGHNIREVSNHNIKDIGQLESIPFIPQIIKQGIFIAEAKNENEEKKDIEKYKYFVTGFKINGADYTVKSAVVVRENGSCYYDHKLTEIEKGTLVSNLTSLLSNEYQASVPSKQYDKRLLQICQCLQKPFLTENFEPKKEIIEQVSNGKTIYELSREKPFTEFTAWKVLDRAALLRKYNPVLDMVYSHHITNQFGLQMFNEREGEKQTVKITGRLTTENVDVLLVDAESENAYPHITLSARKGFSPVKTNGEIAAHLNDIEPLSDKVETVFTNFNEKNLVETEPLAKKNVHIKESEQEIEKKASSKDVATNFVLEKLAKAGIEVISDKTEFKRILATEEILQKMSGDEKFDLFATHNNEKLNEEINSLTINDVNVKNKYIDIADKTPFIFKECGLDEHPVKMYKQKLARAFFLEKEKPGERRTHGHKGEFSIQTAEETFAQLGNPRFVFNSKKNITNPDDYYLIGIYDKFDNEGNPMMLSLRYNRNDNNIEANWVQSIYGRRKSDVIYGLAEGGYLLYANDIEMEKASAETCTLYMRVMAAADAYISNIIRKSHFVNELGINFYKIGEATYGFTHNSKIYLNPDVMNSEAAIHEYTHLWDEYTRRTNPELWQKGKEIFSKTTLWEDVKNDPAYADISDDDNLVLSECHARICGKIAAQVLERIIEQNGEIAKDKAIDWDREVSEYLFTELQEQLPAFTDKSVISRMSSAFISMPMVDLMTGRDILERSKNVLNFRDGLATEKLYDFAEKKLGSPVISKEAAAAIIYYYACFDYGLNIDGNELYEVDTLYKDAKLQQKLNTKQIFKI